MKRRIIYIYLFSMTWFFIQAQEEKQRIAIFDPAIAGSDFDEGTGVIIREMVSTVIVNSGKYTIIERSLIDRVLREQNFSNSGAVDDRQISQIGKIAGAHKVILSVLSSSGNSGLLSLKLIDVESGNIERQKAQVVELSRILDIITPLTLEIIGENAATPVTNQENASQPFSTSVNPVNPSNEQLADRGNREEKSNISNIKLIRLTFGGHPSAKKNPTAKVYVDDVFVGSGNLHQGFDFYFQDNSPGKHKVRIVWSKNVASGVYPIDTSEKKHYVFLYDKFAFGFYLYLSK